MTVAGSEGAAPPNTIDGLATARLAETASAVPARLDPAATAGPDLRPRPRGAPFPAPAMGVSAAASLAGFAVTITGAASRALARIR